MNRTFTTGEVAKMLGVSTWQLVRTIRTGRLAEPPRVGPFRYFVEADLTRVREALVAAGYLAEEVSGAR